MKVITLTGLRGVDGGVVSEETEATGMNKYLKLALWTGGAVIGVTLVGMALSGKVRRRRKGR